MLGDVCFILSNRFLLARRDLAVCVPASQPTFAGAYALVTGQYDDGAAW